MTTFAHAYTFDRCTDIVASLKKGDLSFYATLQWYVCIYEASIAIRVSPIADLGDCRMVDYGFVWWFIQWSVCD